MSKRSASQGWSSFTQSQVARVRASGPAVEDATVAIPQRAMGAIKTELQRTGFALAILTVSRRAVLARRVKELNRCCIGGASLHSHATAVSVVHWWGELAQCAAGNDKPLQ